MLREGLRRLAVEKINPGGEPYHSLSLADAQRLAASAGVTLKEVEIAALEEGIVPERYQRNIGTTGLAGQARLLRSRATVIGAGGLGGVVIELLARMGVGALTIVDGDHFAEHNLNRQLLATEADIGRPKALVAGERVAVINRAVEVAAHCQTATAANIVSFLRGSGVVLDCLDNLPARRLLAAACRDEGIPMVHGAIGHFMGQVATIFPGDTGLNAIYPAGQPERGAETLLGNPPPTVAQVASWQAQEAVKILLGISDLLRHRLLYIDMRCGRVYDIPLSPP